MYINIYVYIHIYVGATERWIRFVYNIGACVVAKAQTPATEMQYVQHRIRFVCLVCVCVFLLRALPCDATQGHTCEYRTLLSLNASCHTYKNRRITHMKASCHT